MRSVALVLGFAARCAFAASDDDIIFASSEGHSFGTVLVSTIDGQITALDSHTGKQKWSFKEGPVLRAPSSIKRGFTFLPNPQDGSLYALKEGTLKKMPFTIPQLVHLSPSKDNDGVLYAGNKKDVWFGIDPDTGNKIETLSSMTMERVCPANEAKTVFVGRSEYHLSMFDANDRTRTWNATFTDYSAHLLPTDAAYPYQHYTSSSTGHVLTVNKDGHVVWEKDMQVPIVAMYLLQHDGLHKLRYTVIGRESMERLIKHAMYHSETWSSAEPPTEAVMEKPTLYQTLYVGESKFGLYAMSAYVDNDAITYAPKYLGPPLIEGGAAIALMDEERPPAAMRTRRIVHVDYASITTTTAEGEFLLLGYHEPPGSDLTLGVIQTRFPSTRQLPSIEYVPDPPPRNVDASDAKNTNSNMHHALQDDTLALMLYQIYVKYPQPFYASMLAVLCLVITTVWLCGRQSGVQLVQANEARSAQTSRQSNSARGWTTSSNDVPEGWFAVGKVHYNPQNVLGRGCEGTVVYRGKFDGREVAVKRVVSEFMRLVEREVDHLRQSDHHPHVIRYFCMESDSQFRYLALELCIASLNDYVENKALRKQIATPLKQLLRQATDGLAHLHSIQIVHRDLKPQNVLLSTANQRGQIRALISDFGLCKRVRPGRHSLSQRSGTAGTDGWIAPEALLEKSTSYPIDIFSLGCIFYFVLSDGSHPFGDAFERQINIMRGRPSLQHLENNKKERESYEAIKQMVHLQPELRPSAQSILQHPIFWGAEKKLQFFGDVSDRVEKEEDSAVVVQRLESNAKAVVLGNWRNHICPALSEDLRKFRTYKGHSVRDLLRAMRNKKHHYRELPDDVRKSLGHIPEDFVHYFTSRYPLLLLHAYEALKWCSNEPVFKNYYADETREQMKNIVEEVEAERLAEKEIRESGETWQRGQHVKTRPELSVAPVVVLETQEAVNPLSQTPLQPPPPRSPPTIDEDGFKHEKKKKKKHKK